MSLSGFSSGFKARTIALPIAAALLVVPLAACSGIGSVTETVSGEGSCQVAAETIDTVISDAQTNAPKLLADLITSGNLNAAALVDPVLKSLDAAAETATDPAVTAAIDESRAVWDGLASDLQGLGTPDLSGFSLSDLGSVNSLDDLSGGLKGYAESLSTIVSERLPELQATGAALQEACSAQ